MKSKLLMVIAINIIILLSGCSELQQSAIQRNDIRTSKDASNIDIVTPSKPNVDYSSYTGNWVCKEKTTSIEIKVDSKGNVTGSITTVEGSHVPSSSIKGIIKEGVLTAELLVDDIDTGTLVLSFTKPEVLIGNVKLDREIDYWTLEQGEMRFTRNSNADNSSNNNLNSNNTVEMSQEEKFTEVTDYLEKSVPEIQQYSDNIIAYNKEHSKEAEVHMIMRLDSEPDHNSSDKYERDYYSVYVGEDHENYTVRWTTFLVNENLKDIYVEDTITGDYVTLDEWRKSQVYNNNQSKDKILETEISDRNGDSTNAVSDANTLATSPSAISDSTNDNVANQALSDNTTNATDMALKALKVVLQDNSKFYNTDTKKNIYFNDFLVNNGAFDCVFKALRFTVLDMDGDKIPEVVIELAIGDNDYAEFYEVLHFMDGKVYGYIFSNRCLGDVKADGTFGYSGGASNNGFGKLTFQGSTSVTNPIGYKESKDSDYQDEVYYIDNKQVTSDKYESFEEEQFAKKEPAWFEFSQSSIDKELS